MWLNIIIGLILILAGFMVGFVVCSILYAGKRADLILVAQTAVSRLRAHENVRDLIQSLEDIT